MAKISVSVDLPLPPEQAWEAATDLERYPEWLTIHRGWRSRLPETLGKGVTVSSVVEVKGLSTKARWTIVNWKPTQTLTLDGQGVGGVKIKMIGRIAPTADGSTVTFDIHLGGRALFGPIGMLVAAALRGDIDASLARFKAIYAPAGQ